eukprot:1742004-Pyramimonas_sp.AAC.4
MTRKYRTPACPRPHPAPPSEPTPRQIRRSESLAKAPRRVAPVRRQSPGEQHADHRGEQGPLLPKL